MLLKHKCVGGVDVGLSVCAKQKIKKKYTEISINAFKWAI